MQRMCICVYVYMRICVYVSPSVASVKSSSVSLAELLSSAVVWLWLPRSRLGGNLIRTYICKISQIYIYYVSCYK